MVAQSRCSQSLHTGQDVATLRRDTDRDRILRADEAVAYGLADTVIRSGPAPLV